MRLHLHGVVCKFMVFLPPMMGVRATFNHYPKTGMLRGTSPPARIGIKSS